MRNVFNTPTKEDIKKAEEEKKLLDQKVKQVAEAARAMLASSDFAKYKETVREAREDMIKLMKLHSGDDPLKFAFFAKSCLSKIDAWDMLSEEIEKDARKDKHAS